MSLVAASTTGNAATGTAQAVGIKANEKYNASKLDEHKRDHSLYTAFAPLEAPTIALAVVVENAGFGSEAAAPMARRVFDYWLRGQYPSVEDMALTQVGKSGAPLGTPRLAASVPLPGGTAMAATPAFNAPSSAPPFVIPPSQPASAAAVPVAAMPVVDAPTKLNVQRAAATTINAGVLR